MTNANDVVILSGARTAIGDFGGSLKEVTPCDLGITCASEAISRAGLEPGDIGHTIIGNVIHTEARDMYLSRVISIGAGVPIQAPAMTLNRLCGSGLQAIVSAAQLIKLGDTDTALAGGAESMSRSPYVIPAGRWGQKMGNTPVLDMMIAALHDPFGGGHMGITAENLARKFDISREAQDAFSLESHRRAAVAISEGRFKEQIVPVEIQTRKGTIVVDTDEHIRHEATLADFEKLRPAFEKDGTVTAGNSSGINDGAAAVVLMNAKTAENRGLKPMARIVSYGHSGVEPMEMGIGPVPAVHQALERAGLSVGDMDVVESNEAFAAQACSVSKELSLDPEKVNPNGGAVALGHPVGASGAIITVKAMYELNRIGGRYGLITMCIGGGQGIAMVIEAI